MVLAARISHVKWWFAALVATAPLTRWLATQMETQASTCPSQILLGTPCPMCGGTRAALYLASGDVVSALGKNAGFVVFCGVMAVSAAIVWGRQRGPGGVANHSEPVADWQT
jgi:hypothetical protein